jgi:hypothetical protein
VNGSLPVADHELESLERREGGIETRPARRHARECRAPVRSSFAKSECTECAEINLMIYSCLLSAFSAISAVNSSFPTKRFTTEHAENPEII